MPVLYIFPKTSEAFLIAGGARVQVSGNVSAVTGTFCTVEVHQHHGRIRKAVMGYPTPDQLR